MRRVSLLLGLVMMLTLGTENALAFAAGQAPSPQNHQQVRTPEQLGGSADGQGSSQTSRNAAVGDARKHAPGVGELSPEDDGRQPADPKSSLGQQPVPAGKEAGQPDGLKTRDRSGGHAGKDARDEGGQPATTTPGPTPDGVEDLGKRTESTSVFTNPDGSKTVRVYSRPVHYKAADGSWADIDTTLSQTRTGRWREAANDQDVTFASSSNAAEVLRWQLDAAHQVSYGLKDAAPVTGRVTGEQLTYPAARPGADVVYNGMAQGIKESLVLHDASAPAVWDFPLVLTGMTASVGAAGQVDFRDEKGDVRLTIPTGFMEDSRIDPASGDGARTGGVTYSLVTEGSAQILRMSLDTAWLKDPKRVYPVKVDPTTTSGINVGRSTFVQNTAKANNSADSTLRIGTYDGGADRFNSYLHFPAVANIGVNYVEAVTLNLNNTHSYECSPHPVNVSQITSGWDPNTINTYPGLSIGQQLGSRNWSHGDTCGGAAWDWVSLGGSHGDAGVQLVESWAHGGANYGLAVTTSNTDSYSWKKFASVNTGYPPYLSIVYSDWAASYNVDANYVPPTATTAGSQRVTMTDLAANWWNSTSMQLKARIFDGNWVEQNVNAPLVGVSGLVRTGESVTVTGVIPPLPANTSYILCWDGYVGGTTSLRDSYGVPPSVCRWITSSNVAPQIDVVEPLAGTAVGTLSPHLYATGHDPDNSPGTGVDYDFKVYTNPSLGSPQLLAESGWQPSTSWRVPVGVLAWNSSYLWTVKAGDHLGESLDSQPIGFTTSVQQPLVTSRIGGAVGNGTTPSFDPQAGNYTTSASDAAVAAVGPSLSVGRTYNSLDPRTGSLFGAGWSSSYDLGVVPEADGGGGVVLTTANGRTERFGRNDFQLTQLATAGDQTGDGIDDAVAVDSSTGKLWVYPGPDFSQAKRRWLGEGWNGVSQIAGGDLNGDGVGDVIAVANWNGALNLYSGQSGSNLGAITTIGASGWNGMQYVTITPPLAADGKKDVVAVETSTGLMYAYPVAADGSLGARVYIGNGWVGFVDVIGGDFNHDGHGDLAALRTDGTLRLYPGTGNATLGTSTMGSPTDLATGWQNLRDLTPVNGIPGDTGTDILAVDRTTGVQYLYHNGGTTPWPAGNRTTTGMPLYTSPAGEFETLAANPGTGFTLADKTGTVYTFAQPSGDGYRLSQITDRQQHTQLLHYAGGKLDSATDQASGRALHFTWTADGKHIASVFTDPAVGTDWNTAQTWTYTYDSANPDRLTQVCTPPAGTNTARPCTTYTYSPGSHFRTTVMDAGPASYWRLGDAAGATGAASENIANQGADKGAYTSVVLGTGTGPLSGSATTVGTFDGTASSVALPNGSLRNSYLAVGLWFKSTSPGALVGYQNQPLGTAPSHASQPLYIGTDGKLRGEFYGTAIGFNPITSTTAVTDGKWHYAVLSGAGDTQTLYLDGAPVGTLNGAIDHLDTDFTYLGAGYTQGIPWPAAPAPGTAGVNHLNGQLAEAAVYPHALGAPAVAAQWAAAQQPSAELTSLALPSGKTKLAVTYDAVNDRATQYTDDIGGVWKLNQPTVSGSEQQYRSAVLSSRPSGYWRLSEGTASQAFNTVAPARTTPDNGTYSNVALGAAGPISGTTSAGFDGTTSWAELPAAHVPTTGTGALALWFKTTKPGVLLGYQSFPLGTTPASGLSWNPALYVGTDGKLHGQFWTGDASKTMAGSPTVTDGNWHQAVLSADTPTTQTLSLDGQTVATLTGAIQPNGASNHVYLGAGAVSSGWPNSPTGDASGHFTGQIADVAAFDHGINAAALYGQAANGATAYDAAVVDAHPSGYWRLNDTSGNQAAELLTSQAQAQNQGSYSNTALNAGGPYGTGNSTAATFNGTTSYVKLPAGAVPRTGGSASVEVWFKTGAAGVVYGTQSFPLGGSATGQAWNPTLYVGTDGKLHGGLWTGSAANTAVSATAVNDNSWHHAALTVAGSGSTNIQQLYVDGVASGSPVTGTTRYNGDQYVYLGAGTTSSGFPAVPADASGHFNGQIADFAYYDYTLSATSISRHYTYATAPAGGAGSQSANYRSGVTNNNPAGYWRLNDPAGATIAQDTLGSALPNQDHGTYTSTTNAVAGPSGSSDGTAVAFNGTTSSLQLPASAAPVRGANSIELWFKTAASGVLYGYQSFPIGAAHTAGVDQWNPALYIGTDGKLYGALWTGDGANALASAKTVNDNTWHHAVLAGDDNGQTLYLDGAQSAATTAKRTVYYNGSSYAYVGAGTAEGGWPNHPTSPDGRFTGTIAEVARYPSVLGADTVTAHYKAMGSASSQTKSTSVSVTEPNGNTMSWRWDTRTGQLATSSDGTGAVTRYSYDTHGFRYSVTDADGHSVTTGHDERGNAVSTTTCTDAAHCHTSYAAYALDEANPFNPVNDRLLTSSDARAANAADTTYATTYTYNALGDPTGTGTPATPDFPTGRTATTAYTTGTEPAVGSTGTQPAALVASNTDTAGATTAYAYDSAGNLTRTTAPTGAVTTYSYDNLGRRTAATTTCTDCGAGATATATYTWDGLNNPLTQTDPATTDAVTGTVHTRKTATAYDSDGNPTAQTVSDTTGGDTPRTTTWTYNAHNQLYKTTDPEGHTTSYGYDPAGNTTGVTDPAGTIWSYSFDAAHRLLRTSIWNYTGSPLDPVPSRFQALESRAYDPAGRLATVTDAMGRTTHTYYNDDNTVAEVDLDGYRNTDGTQRTIVLQQNSYDAAGRPTQQTAGGGKATVVTVYDAAGRTTSTTLDPGGLNRTATYTYDAAGRVLSTTATGGSLTQRIENTYNSAGLLLTETVKGAGTDAVTSHTYNQLGRRTSTTTPNGHAVGADPAAYTSTQAYDTAGRPTVTTGPLVTAETYDPATRTTAPVAVRAVTTTGYDSFGDVTATRDPLGTVTTNTYDLDGRRTATTGSAYTDPRTGTTFTPTVATAYDALDRITSSTVDPSGLALTTASRYDQLGNLVERKQPAVAGTTPTWTYTYDLESEPLAAVSPMGGRTEATYDDLGRRITATQIERQPTPVALTSTFGYDDAGNQTTSTLPKGGTTKTTYDAAGQQLTVTDPAGLTTRTDYDALGRPQKTALPDGTASTTAYDALGNAVATSQLDTAGTTIGTSYATYDLQGASTGSTDRITNQADSAAHTTSRTYDPAGNLIRQVEPVGPQSTITTTFGYDAAGHRTRFTNGMNKATYYTYNQLGLPEATVEPATTAAPGAADSAFTTSYDTAGRATALTEPGGILRQRSYDPLGRITQETATGAEVATPTRTLGYDLEGRLTSATAPTGTNTYTYNDRGSVLTATGPGGNSGYSYDADGNMTGRTDAAGTAAFTYGTADQLLTAADPLTGTTIGYDYDTAGRLKTTRYGTGGSTRNYGYDLTGRLATDTVKNPAGSTVSSLAYTFDANGRITGKTATGTAGAAQNTYAYDLAGRLISWKSGSTTTAYTWDAAGNRTSAGGVSSMYDERNELLDDGANSYTYTPRGTLNSQTVHGAQPSAVQFDGFDRMTVRGPVSYTYDSLDRVTQAGPATFTYDGGSTNKVSDGTSRYSRTPDGGLLAAAGTTTGGARLEITDAHTDVVAALDPTTNTLSSSTAYDPFGKPTARAGTGTAVGYQSAWTDPTTGDVDMAARWYQPGTGTFTARDSWSLNPSPSIQGNRFAYAGGDPLDGTDPSGHCWIPGCDRISKAAKKAGSMWVSGMEAEGRALQKAGSMWVSAMKAEARAYESFLTWEFDLVFGTSNAIGSNECCYDSGSSYASGEKDQFCDTHWWTTQCGGSGRLGGPGGGRGSGGGGGGGGPATKSPRSHPGVDIRKPLPDIRPVNDKNRPVAKPDPLTWFTTGVIAVATPIVTALVGGLETFVAGAVDLAVDLFTEPAPEPEPAPRSDRNERKKGDCRNAFGGGWREYSPVDVTNGSRATGVTACLTADFIKNHGSQTETRGEDGIRPPGYFWANKFVKELGNGDKAGVLAKCLPSSRKFPRGRRRQVRKPRHLLADREQLCDRQAWPGLSGKEHGLLGEEGGEGGAGRSDRQLLGRSQVQWERSGPHRLRDERRRVRPCHRSDDTDRHQRIRAQCHVQPPRRSVAQYGLLVALGPRLLTRANRRLRFLWHTPWKVFSTVPGRPSAARSTGTRSPRPMVAPCRATTRNSSGSTAADQSRTTWRFSARLRTRRTWTGTSSRGSTRPCGNGRPANGAIPPTSGATTSATCSSGASRRRTCSVGSPPTRTRKRGRWPSTRGRTRPGPSTRSAWSSSWFGCSATTSRSGRSATSASVRSPRRGSSTPRTGICGTSEARSSAAGELFGAAWPGADPVADRPTVRLAGGHEEARRSGSRGTGSCTPGRCRGRPRSAPPRRLWAGARRSRTAARSRHPGATTRPPPTTPRFGPPSPNRPSPFRSGK
ncbi:RHS repeat-associated protein [Streptomyces sp. TLI_171]|nr:LamG-like jellyroll fold domain-containing protein [Streptomyces sp. TLI_171]RKE05089.1 RHS repeat-associated protein [Streptomyces sp. TLI_171]